MFMNRGGGGGEPLSLDRGGEGINIKIKTGSKQHKDGKNLYVPTPSRLAEAEI